MAVIGNTNPTYVDVAKATDPNGKIAKLAEVLNQTNPVLEDATAVEGNLPTGHKGTIRSGLPTPTWRRYNEGVQPTKSRSVEVTASCGMLEDYAEVDKALVDLNGNTTEFRFSEDKAHIEGMNQEMAKTLFYGNDKLTPGKFTGLAAHYNDKSAANAECILDAGGSGSTNTSIFMVTWSPETTFCIYPKGSKAGLFHQDLGEHTLFDANGGRYQGYRSHYKWDNGLFVKDWRYNVRIPNIDVTALTKNAATGADLLDLMIQMVEILPSQGMGRTVIYANRTITSFFRRQLLNKNNVYLTLDTVGNGGRKVLHFDGIPIRKCHALVNTEARVT